MEPKHPLKGIFIVDLRPGERVPGAFFLVRHKQLEPFRDRSKGEFLTLTLGDRTGQMLARVWEGAPELAETFAEGDVVKVAGDVEEYLGRAQIIVNKLRRAGEEEYDLSDFLPATEKNLDDLLAHVQAAVDSLQSPHLAALVRRFYDDPDFRARLAQAPAARRVHHAYLGGLLEHLVDVLTLCETVLQLYPEINADLLLKATKVDGIYSDDPKTHSDAMRYKTVSFDEAIAKNLKVMDATALTLCRDQKLPINVFSIFKQGALKRVVMGEDEGTQVLP